MSEKNNGFTLLELMVVLSILALVALASLPLISNSLDKIKVKQTAFELADALRLTRRDAITGTIDKTLLLDTNSYAYSEDNGNSFLPFNLPEEANLFLTTAKSEQVNEHTGNIRFFKDGSSTGAQIKLSYRNVNYQIDVNWLNGQVTLQ